MGKIFRFFFAPWGLQCSETSENALKYICTISSLCIREAFRWRKQWWSYTFWYMLQFLENFFFSYLAFYRSGVHKIASPFSTREERWCLNEKHLRFSANFKIRFSVFRKPFFGSAHGLDMLHPAARLPCNLCMVRRWVKYAPTSPLFAVQISM